MMRAQIMDPFDDKIISLEDNEIIILKVKTFVSWRAARDSWCSVVKVYPC
jgi:hypothetical protein